MDFPYILTVLDDFNRSNEGPPMTGWVDLQGGLKVLSNECIGSVGGSGVEAANHSAFNTSFDSDQECQIEYRVLPLSGEEVNLYVRVVSTTLEDGGNCYGLIAYYNGTNTDFFLIRIDSGAPGRTGSTTNLTIGIGDKIGLRAFGSIITAWHKPSAGSWTLIDTWIDTTWTHDGYMSLDTNSDTIKVDNFIGGALVWEGTSTGAISPASAAAASETPHSDDNWANPTNIFSDDGSSASITASTFDSGDQSYILKAYNFDLSGIPSGATILGVIVRLNAWYANGTASIDLLQLLDTSLAKVGTNQCATAFPLSTDTGSVLVFGAGDDTWGNSLTDTWVKNSNFGVAIGILSTGANTDVFIDHVTLEVYYEASTIETATVSPVIVELTPPTVSASYHIAATVAPAPISLTIPAVTATYTQIETAAVAPVVLVVTLTNTTAISIFTATVSPFSIAFTLAPITATYEQVATAAVSPVGIVFTQLQPIATYTQVETATVAPAPISLTIPAVTATYTQVETAAVAPVVLSIISPAVTASGSQAGTATVSPLVVTITVSSVAATYTQIETAAVAPVVVTLVTPPVTASGLSAGDASVLPIPILFSIVSVTATYTQVETATVSPLPVVLTPASVIASYIQVGSATPSPLSISLTIHELTATYTQVEAATVAPVVITLAPPSVTPTYIQVNSATVIPLVLLLAIASVTANMGALIQDVAFSIRRSNGSFERRKSAATLSRRKTNIEVEKQ